MSVDRFTFEEVPQQERCCWFVRYGAKTVFDRRLRSKDEASSWFDNFGRRLDWRAGFAARLRGDDKDIEIVDSKGQVATVKENDMLNELLPDVRKLLHLVRKLENFDATVAAARAAGEAIEPEQSALDERKRIEKESVYLREKWGI